MITIKQLDKSAATRVGEIDRSEYVTLNYVYNDGKLEDKVVDWDVPRWHSGNGSHSVGHMIDFSKRMLSAEGAVLLGALDGEMLVGIAIYRPGLTEKMAQLALLQVNRAYRRQGIAKRFTDEMVKLAKADGATEMYVSATPSESAVGFYCSQGFEIAPPDRIHPELFEEEPEDIHMIMPLIDNIKPNGDRST
jgi:N-acetylglutamate synthase-like GNAT family acetyltransferase